MIAVAVGQTDTTGVALPAVTLIVLVNAVWFASLGVKVTLCWVVPATGTTQQSVTFTPSDANHTALTSTINVTAGKATPVVSVWPTATAIIYGQTLASST